jgi:hypothetical protein
MVELKEKANCYAEENVVNVLKEAFAKVYADGYRDGYKDREEEVPVDLRNNRTEYVDLGLPSGTLWSKDYEKNDKDHYEYLPYLKASKLQIPTEEQWKELTTECRWEYERQNGYRFICIGPNGNSIKFVGNGGFKAESYTCFNRFNSAIFWLKDENDKPDKKGTLICHTNNINIILKTDSYYMGYKLPVRLVKTK